ncbi:hypothetical protein DL93DRAFT_577709 [Clavulina sp. PMI_390]|nr:hypothetical protein DL93DRAFT_577709 [Clavulina sp. PMI_390]
MAVLTHARRIVLRAYTENDAALEIADLSSLERMALYFDCGYDEAVRALQRSVQLFHALDPQNSVRVPHGLLKCLDRLALSLMNIGTTPLALEAVLDAVKCPEEGDWRFGSGVDADDTWQPEFFTNSLAHPTQIYCLSKRFRDARMEGVHLSVQACKRGLPF